MEPQVQSKSFESYAELLKGKRVVVVGPSAYMKGSGLGKTIESYDLVVRINFQWPIPTGLTSDVGKRLDILYHCCNGDRPIRKLMEEVGFKKVKFVCYERGFESLLLSVFCRMNGIESECVSATYRELFQRLNTFPNTGTVAIHHLLKFPIKELLVCGISFFRENYYSDYPGDGAHPSHWEVGLPSKIWNHEFNPQLDHFRSLLKEDRRLCIDKRLSEILEVSSVHVP